MISATDWSAIKTNDNYCRLPVDQVQLFSHTYLYKVNWFASCQLEFLSLWATMKTAGLRGIIVLPLKVKPDITLVVLYQIRIGNSMISSDIWHKYHE